MELAANFGDQYGHHLFRRNLRRVHDRESAEDRQRGFRRSFNVTAGSPADGCRLPAPPRFGSEAPDRGMVLIGIRIEADDDLVGGDFRDDGRHFSADVPDGARRVRIV